MDFFEEHEPLLAERFGGKDYVRRTNICIVFEKLYNLVKDHSEEVRELIVEGYFMGKRMSNKISFYKGEEQKWQQVSN